MLQTRSAPRPAAELLQRLQPHGPVPALPHPGHALRQASRLLLHTPAVAVAADVAIARGPPSRRQGSALATHPARSESARPGPGAAVARAGGPPSGRVLPAAADARPVDLSP